MFKILMRQRIQIKAPLCRQPAQILSLYAAKFALPFSYLRN